MSGWIFGIEVVLYRWESDHEEKACSFPEDIHCTKDGGEKLLLFFECSSCMSKHMESGRQSLVFRIPSGVKHLPDE